MEMRSVEEASNAMALDGIIFEVILFCYIPLVSLWSMIFAVTWY